MGGSTKNERSSILCCQQLNQESRKNQFQRKYPFLLLLKKAPGCLTNQGLY
ncbi:hypothetical protein SynBMKMC1_01263 [Synechococcus sp. BMK-MC-1]|nr:hypothetical protein SynBMKMC1_01263 [Synechococcus sp. BMK-MC-1]